MSNRYVIKFKKGGYVKYTSHLDLLRTFKRSFRKTGVPLAYSQGYNPHPKMGFAQPLSLGYSGICELIEFETTEPLDREDALQRLQAEMPDGVELVECKALNIGQKSLAGETCEATYMVELPLVSEEDVELIPSKERLDELIEDYLSQPTIMAEKRMKKTKRMEPVDIKSMIRRMEGVLTKVGARTAVVLSLRLDSGSTSNCSPELVIKSFVAFTGLGVPRHLIDVERTSINFYHNLQI